MAEERFRYLAGKPFPVYRQRVTGGHLVVIRAAHDQRIHAPHLLLQEADGAGQAAAAETVGTHQLREILRMVGRRLAVRLHFNNGDRNAFPEPYWSNTSSNSIIKELVEQSTGEQRRELDTLIDGGTIEKQVHEDITYDDIHASEDNLWNFLFFTGYMKKVSERFEGENIYLTMCIPNAEIRYIYANQIRSWFDRIVKTADKGELYQAVRNRDTETMTQLVKGLLRRAISTFDSEEAFYHGFLLSLLINFPDYEVRSNREAGDGRPDIILYPEEETDPAYIFEIKVRKKFNRMQDGLDEAFRQIRDKRYADGILEEGYAGVVAFGVCFCKKTCIFGEYRCGSEDLADEPDGLYLIRQNLR